MNYGQFIYMFPECALVVALIIVFAFDFAMTKTGEMRGEKKHVAIGRLTYFMLMTVGLGVFSAMRQGDTITAFGGMYVATQAINVMKMVLTFGTFIVVIMAESWTAKQQRIAGEFYMLILSTLLGYVHDDVGWLVPAVLPGLGDGFSAPGLYGGFRSPS